MLSLFIVTVLSVGAFEAGGRVGVLFPGSGLENSHGTAAVFDLGIGYRTNRSHFALAYGYSGLGARQAGPYRLELNELSLGYLHELFRREAPSGMASNWGFELGAAAGYSLLSRTLGSARETGGAPAGHLTLGFFQRQGHSRLALSLDNLLFLESQPAGGAGALSLTYLPALKGGIAYVF
ncbi:hypothetical protein FJY70_00985 [candidate division WOR-3 bacterium]|nr:hypothetical protein [candidate division WOR-3 bacterium]